MCPEDFYCPLSSGTITPQPCPPGYFCPNKLSTNPTGLMNQMTLLLDDNFGTRNYLDFPCPPRYACGDNFAVSSMEYCPEAFYTETYKNTECLSCPGSLTCSQGRIELLCQKGQFCDGTSNPCPAGTYNPNQGKG